MSLTSRGHDCLVGTSLRAGLEGKSAGDNGCFSSYWYFPKERGRLWWTCSIVSWVLDKGKMVARHGFALPIILPFPGLHSRHSSTGKRQKRRMGKECWAHRGSAKAVPPDGCHSGYHRHRCVHEDKDVKWGGSKYAGSRETKMPHLYRSVRYTSVCSAVSLYKHPSFPGLEGQQRWQRWGRYSLHAGGEHCDLALAVEVRRGTLWS